jgi:hypothetical protein
VTWTATNGAATIGHGLGVAPSMIFVKDRTSIANWTAYHVSVGNTSGLVLNTTAASAASINYWNNTSPTSTVFSVGSYSNYLTDAHVAYCFAAVAGYSAFGKYTGNGSTDGPFVYCGFRPRWVLIKGTAASTNWVVIDTSRSPYNEGGAALYPNLSNAEGTNSGFDIYANGFKLKNNTGTDVNANGSTYIYAVFAENPFKNSLAR